MLAAAPPDLALVADRTPSVVAVAADGATELVADRTLLLAVRRGQFELWATRASGGAVEVAQVLGSARTRLPVAGASFTRGLPHLVRVVVRRPDGPVVRRAFADVCPNDRDARPLRPPSAARAQRYPYDCGHELSRAVVWGIESGWAVPVSLALPGLQPGRYEVEASLVPGRVRQAGRAGDAVRFPLQVRSERARATPPRPPTPAVGAATSRGLPDLVALPPDGIEVVDGTLGRDILRFGSNIWNAGSAPARVIGRRASSDTGASMSAFQVVAGREQRAGRLVYDVRDGHRHWHFDGLARYRLLQADGTPVVTSTKIGFCFGSTDAIDLSLHGAPWRPARSSDRCAARRPRARTVSMDIQVGWGDQYDQTLPGQALDVTDLPNGVYLLEVVVDPQGRLVQASRANDRATRRIVLGGAPGARIVATDAPDGLARVFRCQLG